MKTILHKTAHHMYFLALVCPPPLDEKILRFKNWMKEKFGCVVALRSPAHITLVPPFWLNDTREEELINTLQSFSSDVGEILVNVNGFSHFGKRVLFAAVDTSPELQLIKTEVEEHVSSVFPEIKKDERPFHPHITIANRDMKPSDFESASLHFSTMKLDEKFVTSQISLLKHDQGRWNVIGRREWKRNSSE